MIRVVGQANPIWMPVDYGSGGASTVYVGQFVTAGYVASCQGVKPWVVAGVADTTAGIPIRQNNKSLF